jgi:hypothetical protein
MLWLDRTFDFSRARYECEWTELAKAARIICERSQQVNTNCRLQVWILSFEAKPIQMVLLFPCIATSVKTARGQSPWHLFPDVCASHAQVEIH